MWLHVRLNIKKSQGLMYAFCHSPQTDLPLPIIGGLVDTFLFVRALHQVRRYHSQPIVILMLL
jgi:hypothetical protein